MTLTDWVRLRFGRPAQVWVAVVSVFYMFMFITAELTAIGDVLDALGGIDPWVSIVAVAGATVRRTPLWGGLPASLRTDQVQGPVTIIVLLTVAMGAILINVDDPLARAQDTGLPTFSRAGWETLIVLCIAITVANLFHQGYWQRSWSASSSKVLVKAGWGRRRLQLPAAATHRVHRHDRRRRLSPRRHAALAGAVLLAPGRPARRDHPARVRAVGGPRGLQRRHAAERVLVVTMAKDLTDRSISLTVAKVATVLLTIPAVFIALRGYDALRLFLIADLVASATVLPVFLGLRRASGSASVVIGSLSGLSWPSSSSASPRTGSRAASTS